MFKKILFIFVFLAITLIQTQFAIADYQITNESPTEPAWVTYSMWQPATRDWPAGWRTTGWYEIKPDTTRNLQIPVENTWVYIYIQRGGKEIKPTDHTTRDNFLFWIHLSKVFTVVETDNGNFLKSDHEKWDLKQADLYEYRNGGSHTIPDAPQKPPDLSARKIYDQSIHSVVLILIETVWGESSWGSGVLIDKERRLVVTNQHVISDTVSVSVLFPYRDRNGELKKEVSFYLKNAEWLVNNRYATQGQVIAQNAQNDLAIVQLDWLPPTTREIPHNFSQNVEDHMEAGDKVHILGNPENQLLWHWTQGTFVSPWPTCPVENGQLIGCLEMEAATHGGNSGGPVLNSQGVLIGILTAGNDEVLSLAAPTRNIKALLETLRHAFKIENPTPSTRDYQIKWSNNHNWQQYSVKSGEVFLHWWGGNNVPQGYPKIRFDRITGDQWITYHTQSLETILSSEIINNNAPIYIFHFPAPNQLELALGVPKAPTLSITPAETILLSNYPNPFNPETWIPYQLAKPAKVTVSIYATDGQLVRTLDLGHQRAGVYQNKSRAVYWDGKNKLGEPVASGVYFYTLTAGDFTATRKMLILK